MPDSALLDEVVPTEAAPDLVARMRQDRLDRGLTLYQYASLIGMSERGLRNMLSRRTVPRPLTLARVTRRLGWRP